MLCIGVIAVVAGGLARYLLGCRAGGAFINLNTAGNAGRRGVGNYSGERVVSCGNGLNNRLRAERAKAGERSLGRAGRIDLDGVRYRVGGPGKHLGGNGIASVTGVLNKSVLRTARRDYHADVVVVTLCLGGDLLGLFTLLTGVGDHVTLGAGAYGKLAAVPFVVTVAAAGGEGNGKGEKNESQ